MKKILILWAFFLTILFSSCESQEESYPKKIQTQTSTNENSTSVTRANSSSESYNSQKSRDSKNTSTSFNKTKKKSLNDENLKDSGNNKGEMGYVVINGKTYLDQIVFVINENNNWVIEIKDNIPIITESTSFATKFKEWLNIQELNDELTENTFKLKMINTEKFRITSFKFKSNTIIGVIKKKDLR